MSPALARGFLTTAPPGKPGLDIIILNLQQKLRLQQLFDLVKATVSKWWSWDLNLGCLKSDWPSRLLVQKLWSPDSLCMEENVLWKI